MNNNNDTQEEKKPVEVEIVNVTIPDENESQCAVRNDDDEEPIQLGLDSCGD